MSFRIYISVLKLKFKENRFSPEISQSPMILKSKDYLVWEDDTFISANVLNFRAANLTVMIAMDSKFPLRLFICFVELHKDAAS